MVTLIDVAICTLASWQIVETVRHGGLFSSLRRWANANKAQAKPTVAWLAKLVSCPFCLSHWAPWVPLLLCFYGDAWMKLPVYVLGITRLTQIGNDLLHAYSRSPSPDDETVIDETT